MYKEWFWMRWVGRVLVLCGWWKNAVLQHGRAAEGVFLPAAEAAAKEGEPTRSWSVGDAEGEESVATAIR